MASANAPPATVVITGAGPAGAALAYLLARRGIGVTLLERQTDFAREFRGEGLMPSGVDAFAQMGLGAALERVPQIRLAALELFRGARRLVRLELAADSRATWGLRIVSQPAMLEMLVAEAARYPSFRLERGVTVRDVVWEGERAVGVRADSASGALEARGDFVIATDGRTSVMRRRAGLHEERSPQAFDVVWGKVPMPDFMAARATARAYVGGGHLALAFPSYDGRLQFGWIIQKGTFGELRRHGIDGWLDQMAAHVSPDLGAHLNAHRAEVTHPFLLDVLCGRLARWTVPGLLLLGDAAHPMSPVGGQGLNIALRDALVAANHLCPLLERGAPASDLDNAARRIQDERMPEVATVQEMQRERPRLIFSDGWWSRAVLSTPVLTLLRIPVLRGLVARDFRRFATGVSTVRL